MSRKSKIEMIEEMQKSDWPVSSTKNDSYQTVKDEYDTFIDEMSSDSDMFPNGRDFDAEDEDGPF